MSRIIGLNPTGIDLDPQFGVNQFGSQDDHEYLYVKVNGAVGARGEVLVVDTDGLAHPITTSVDLVGRRCGIAPDAAAIGRYCWVLVRGDAEFLVAANCAAHKSLRATTVGGVVDDAGSGPVIEGMVATVAAGAMQTLVKGRLVYPTLQEAGGGGSGVSDFLSLDDTPAAFGTVGQAPVVNALGTALVFADAGGSFDLHDDITTEVTAIAGSDRFVISDESGTGDPNRYVECRDILDAIRDILNVNNSTPATTDRLYISDESGTGDPMEYITLAQLTAAIIDGTVDTVAMTVVGQTLTLTIGRTVGVDIVAQATLPAGGNGGGGGGGLLTVAVSATSIFSSTLTDIADIATSLTWQDVLSGLSTNTRINIGSFTIDTDLSSRDSVIIPKSGSYNLVANISGAADTATSAQRGSLQGQFVRKRGGVDTILPPRGTPSYARNQYANLGMQEMGTHLDLIDLFVLGDEVRVQVRYLNQSSTINFNITGANSLVSLVEEDAPTVTVTGFPTPGLVGTAYSGTLVMDTWADTSIALPADGWIRLIGSVAGGSYFSVSTPAVLIDDKTEGTVGTAPDTDTDAVQFPAAAGMTTRTVSFGHDSSGNILIASNAAGAAILSVYQE